MSEHRQDLTQQRSPFETDEQWEERKRLMERHKAFCDKLAQAALTPQGGKGGHGGK